MGFLDILILGSTGLIFLISLILLIFSLRSTTDEVRRMSYKKTYVPVISVCLMVFICYVFILSIGSIVI